MQIVGYAESFRSQQASDRQVREFTHGTTYNLPPAVDDDLAEPSIQQSSSDTTQTFITADGSVTRFAVPADEEDPEEVSYFCKW